MKTYILFIFLFFISLVSVNNAYAQQQDSLKQRQIRYFSKVLTASQDTAQMVATIMDTYKEGVRKVTADITLTDETRRSKIDDLIAEKNLKLVRLLSHSQLVKIIPSTERIPNPSGK